MKKSVWLIAVIVLGLAAALLFFTSRFDRQEGAGSAETDVVQEYFIDDVTDIGPQRRSDYQSRLKKIYYEEYLWEYGFAETPDNFSRIELRFRKPSPTGEMVPCRLAGINIRPWRLDVDYRYRMRPRTDHEFGVASFLGHNLDIDIVGAEALRLFVTDNFEAENFYGLYMGQKYYIQVGLIDEEKSIREMLDASTLESGSFLLRVPDNIPPGKVAVMEVDVMQQFEPW